MSIAKEKQQSLIDSELMKVEKSRNEMQQKINDEIEQIKEQKEQKLKKNEEKFKHKLDVQKQKYESDLELIKAHFEAEKLKISLERSAFLSPKSKAFTFSTQAPIFIKLANSNGFISDSDDNNNLSYGYSDSNTNSSMISKSKKRRGAYLTLSFPEIVNKFSISPAYMRSSNFIADIPPQMNRSSFARDSFGDFDNDYQQQLQMKRQMEYQLKMQKKQSFFTFKFDNKAKKTFNRLEQTSADLQDEFRDTANETTSIMFSMKQLLADQGKFISQISSDFQQQAAQVARSIQGTVADIDSSFRSAMNSVTSYRTNGIMPPPPSIPPIQPISQPFISSTPNTSITSGAIQPFQPSPFFIQPPIVSSSFKEQPFRRSKRNTSKNQSRITNNIKQSASIIRSRNKSKAFYDQDNNENDSYDYNDLIDSSTDETISFISESENDANSSNSKIQNISSNQNINTNNQLPNQNLMAIENSSKNEKRVTQSSNNSTKSTDSNKKVRVENTISVSAVPVATKNITNNVNTNAMAIQSSKNQSSANHHSSTKKSFNNKTSFQSLLEDQSDSISD